MEGCDGRRWRGVMGGGEGVWWKGVEECGGRTGGVLW